MRLWQFSAVLLVFASNLLRVGAAGSSTDISGRVFLPEGLRDTLSVIGVDAEVTLDFGRYKGGIKKDGTFTIHQVPAGLYILDVTSVTHVFDKLWIEVDPADDAVRASVYIPGAEYDPGPKRMVPYPLELSSRGPFDYFQAREGFNWWAIVSNPMMLMAGFSIIMVYALPKLMESLPEEDLRAARESQARALGAGSPRAGGGGA